MAAARVTRPLRVDRMVSNAPCLRVMVSRARKVSMTAPDRMEMGPSASWLM